MAELRDNIRQGAGPQSLAEKRELAQAEREAKAAEEKRLALKNITFGEVFARYLPEAAANKRPYTVKCEEQYFRLWVAPLLGKKPLLSIAPLDLERLKKTMADAGRSPNTPGIYLDLSDLCSTLRSGTASSTGAIQFPASRSLWPTVGGFGS